MAVPTHLKSLSLVTKIAFPARVGGAYITFFGMCAANSPQNRHLGLA